MPSDEPNLLPVAPGYKNVLRVRMAIAGLVLTGTALHRRSSAARPGRLCAALLVGSSLVLAIALIFVAPERIYRRLRYGLGGRLLQVVRGWLFHTDTVVPLVRVQHLDVVRGPFDKMFGTASLVVHTAGTHNSVVTVPGPGARARRRDARHHPRACPAPTLPDDSAVGPPERLHPLFLLNGLGEVAPRDWRSATLSSAISSFPASGASRSSPRSRSSCSSSSVGRSSTGWRFEYRVGADEIRIDSGVILAAATASIPFDRIQDADITQGPLDRLLGSPGEARNRWRKRRQGRGRRSASCDRAATGRRAPQADPGTTGRDTLGRSAVQEDRLPVYAMDLGRVAHCRRCSTSRSPYSRA